LAERLAANGFETNISTRSPSRFTELSSTIITPFIIDIDQFKNSINSFLDSPILIINITSKNSDSFCNLITEIEQSAVEKIIFVSSTSVYQNTNTLISESDGAETAGSALLQIENLFRNNKHFQTTIVRLAGLIGPQRHPGRFFRNGKKVQQANAPVNLIHLDDCIMIIQEIIEQNVWGETFNACADSHPTKREFYSHARQLLSLPPPEFIETEKEEYKIINNMKLKQILNYSFKHPDVMKITFKDDA
jgi:nucleoside-diphosphate-sugar epimerase